MGAHSSVFLDFLSAREPDDSTTGGGEGQGEGEREGELDPLRSTLHLKGY